LILVIRDHLDPYPPWKTVYTKLRLRPPLEGDGCSPGSTWSRGLGASQRPREFTEEYGITVVYVNEAHASSKCSIRGEKCGEMIKRGLSKCTKLNKVFNADLVGAHSRRNPRSLGRGGGQKAF
jgi:hypothetical protein